MSKKLIAAMLALTTIFVCVFAACNDKDDDETKDTRPYIENDEYEFVTDENGEKILNEDGEFIVYATEENGKIVTDENGENVTRNQLFQAFQNGDTFEDYGYKIKLPEGWASTSEKGEFENVAESQTVEITYLNKTYSEYYSSNLEFYEKIKELMDSDSQQADSLKDIEWNEEIIISDDFEGLVRFSLTHDENIVIMYFFMNSDNLYKILFNAPNTETAMDDSLEICKAISFKPYQYYPVVDETTNG